MPGLITVTLIDAHNMQPLFSNVATLVNQHMIIYNYIMLHLILYQKNWTLMNPNLSYRSVQEIKENDFFCYVMQIAVKITNFPLSAKINFLFGIGNYYAINENHLKTTIFILLHPE